MTSTTDTVNRATIADTIEPAAAAGASAAVTATPAEAVRWHPTTRIAFRFFALYFTLYIFCTQMFGSLFGRFLQYLPFQVVPPNMSQTVQTFGSYIAIGWLHFPEPLSTNRGAGDKPFDYALVVGLLAVAAALTTVWSAVDFRRQSYPGLNAWFRTFLRLGIATSFASYGWMKAYPIQMSYPSLTRMLEPYGHFSLMGVLWAKIGASPAYEVFTGCAELLAAVLLLIPGLTTVGALVSIAVAAQVWILNMTYDVPVKLFSLHLLVMSVFLLAPDMRRLFAFLVLKRPVDPPREGRLFRNRTAHRVAVALQVIFAVWVMWTGFQGAQATYARTGGAPKPPLYGVWIIDRMTIDGVERAPLVTDYDRWRRLVIQSPAMITFQRMDDTFVHFPAKLDLPAGTIVLNAQNKPIGQFAIQQPASDKLVLEGTVNGRSLRMETSYFDPNRFLLNQMKFRWIQNVPFNR